MTRLQNGTDALRFARFDDPNVALGLAVRLVAAVPPFDEMPLGFSAAMLVRLIDRGTYGFAVEGGAATGFACWARCPAAVAERFGRGDKTLTPDDFAGGPAAVVFAFRAVRPAVTRFLIDRLRTLVLADAEQLVYVRDYGPARGSRRSRVVRMTRTEDSVTIGRDS